MYYLKDEVIGSEHIELNAIQGEYKPFFIAKVNKFLDPPTEKARS